MARKKHYTGANALVDLILTFLTGGLWLIWVLFREIRLNS